MSQTSLSRTCNNSFLEYLAKGCGDNFAYYKTCNKLNSLKATFIRGLQAENL
jgi:hypothetical protein